jgi:hypothetical protein
MSMKMKYVAISTLALAMLVLTVIPALAKGHQKVGFGELWYDGKVVRTVVPAAATPKKGRDNLYVVMAVPDQAVPDQRPVAAVAPGDKGYHGGKWAFHSVTWNVAPYLLTSEAEVLAAEEADDVEVVRVKANDFKCPIQP